MAGRRRASRPLPQCARSAGQRRRGCERSEFRTPSLPPSRQAPAAAPDLVTEGWRSIPSCARLRASVSARPDWWKVKVRVRVRVGARVRVRVRFPVGRTSMRWS